MKGKIKTNQNETIEVTFLSSTSAATADGDLYNRGIHMEDTQRVFNEIWDKNHHNHINIKMIKIQEQNCEKMLMDNNINPHEYFN